jgi:hypothetical protein
VSDPEPRRSPSSIELLLDPETETAVRAEWDALAALGMSSLAGHTSTSNRPHVTLAVRLDLPMLGPGALSGISAFPITLGAPLLFGTGERRVLARSILPTAELLALHSAVHDALGPGDDVPHTGPGEWTPHVSLARRLRVTDTPAALDRLGGDIRGHAASVRRWDAVEKVSTVLVDLAPV